MSSHGSFAIAWVERRVVVGGLMAGALFLGACTDQAPPAPAVSDTIVSTTIAAVTTTVVAAPTLPPRSVAPMTLEISWAPTARWADGAAPSAADLECTRAAALASNDPVERRRYSMVSAIDDDVTTGRTIVEFSAPDSGYQRLFDHVLHAVNGNCTPGSLTVGPAVGALVVVDSVGAPGLPDPLTTGAVAMEIGQPRSIPSGASIVASSPVAGPMVSIIFSRTGRLADDTVRRAVSMSIDRGAAITDAFTPMAPLVTSPSPCGPWPAASPSCTGVAFQNTFDIDGAARVLTDAGWVRDANGYWAKDGASLVLRFVVPDGDRVAADLQTSIAPRLAAAGFDVRVATCSTRCREGDATAFDITVATAGVGDAPDVDALIACGIDDAAVGLGPCDASVTTALGDLRTAVGSPTRVAATGRLAAVLAERSMLLPMAQQPRTVTRRSDVVISAPSPLVALTLRDLFAVAPQLEVARGAGASTQTKLTVAVDRASWCAEPWWACGTSVSDALAGGVLAPSVWDMSSSGPIASTALDGEPRLDVTVAG